MLAAGSVAAQTPSPSPFLVRFRRPLFPDVTLPAPLARVLTADYESGLGAEGRGGPGALFADGGFVLSSGVPPVRGRAAIERHYTGQGGPLALRALAYAVDGKIGYVIGGFARAKGEAGHRRSSRSRSWRRRTGAWLIQSDMDNGNARSR